MKHHAVHCILICILVLSGGCIQDIKDIFSPFIPEQYAKMYGITRDRNENPLESVTISLTGEKYNYSTKSDMDGRYSIPHIYEGTYSVTVEKEGYKKMSSSYYFMAGYTVPWNFTLYKDCKYYPVNTSANFVVRYGYNVTVYKGNITAILSYPEGAEYQAWPKPDGDLSKTSVVYRAGNRMLKWDLDNSNGRYPYIEGYFYMDLDGTREMKIFAPTEMSITAAAKEQPGYLSDEWKNEKEGARCMIAPSDGEIKEIANKIKNETHTDNVWVVARELFRWLVNNTYYQRDVVNHTQSAMEVLHSGKGDCDELSFLYVSLCRAAGIPARWVSGYMVKRNPEEYTGHAWAEFYDGEWVTVECAGNGSVEYELDRNFGIYDPDHIAIFFDDGTNESQNYGKMYAYGRYYDYPAKWEIYAYYNAIEYNKMYIAVYPDEHRELVEEME